MTVPATWDRNNTSDSLSAFSNGDRTFTAQGSGRWTCGTLGVLTVDKFYFEATRAAMCNAGYDYLGFKRSDGMHYLYRCSGSIITGTSSFTTRVSGLEALAWGDVLGFAARRNVDTTVDFWFRQPSGAWATGDPAAGTDPAWTAGATALDIFPYIRSSYNWGGTINCGQEAYTHTPPAGFADLAIPDITQFEDLALDLSYIHDHLEDIKIPLQLAALVVESLPSELRLALSSLEGDLPLAARLCAQWRRSLPLEIRLDGGEDFADLAAMLSITDGTALADLPVRALLTRTAPLYRAVIAQRLRSVKHA